MENYQGLGTLLSPTLTPHSTLLVSKIPGFPKGAWSELSFPRAHVGALTSLAEPGYREQAGCTHTDAHTHTLTHMLLLLHVT